MNKYGQIAVRAAQYVNCNLSPREAWDKASCEIYPKGSASQRKSCPRTTFLALYDQTLQSPNALHARDARSYLAAHCACNTTPKALWESILNGNHKTHNSQMDVVLALYSYDLMPE
ncbi:MAG TPA: hypothetical protein PKU80_02815 [Candidatus Limiplasma sp.]|nr:hypothetical protein [Candidatus Limiplasma sp.]HRX08116.1 hypothetical protein [Candidatus Limiplasma sp.]